MSGPTGVIARRVVAIAAQQVAKQVPQQVRAPLLVPPAVFFTSQRWALLPAREASGKQQQKQEQQKQEQQKHSAGALAAPAVQRRPRFRRFKAVAAAAARVLPWGAARGAATVFAAAAQLTSLAASVPVSGAAVGGLAVGIAAKGIRRWQVARRSARRAMVTVNAGPAAEVSVVTFNIRGIMDRWPDRAPLLRRCLKQADADVFCFQEVLTGEFAQELQLLGPDYHVHECRAALQHLSASSLLGAAYVSTVRALLRLSWTRSLLVSLPESVEGWREQHQLAGNWSRLLRDLAIAPFYGNSIATRLPAAQLEPPQSSKQQPSSSSKAAGLAGSITGCCSSTSSSGGWGTSSWSSGWGSSSSKAASDLLVLGDFRAAQRVCVQLQLSPAPAAAPQQQQQQGDGSSSAAEHSGSSSSEVAYVWLVNTHLDHAAADIRKRQAQAICSWMEPLKASCAGIVMTGDLNAPPDEALHATMAAAGFMSAHKAAHGSEPSHTWPSGIQAPLMDEGEPHCADYVYAWQAPGYQLLVTAAQLCGDQPSEQDATLYPSDHIGIKVKLRVVASSSSSGSSGQGDAAAGAASGPDGRMPSK